VRARLRRNLGHAQQMRRMAARTAARPVARVVAVSGSVLRSADRLMPGRLLQMLRSSCNSASRRAFRAMWHRAGAWRPLLSAEPDQLSVGPLTRRLTLQAFLALPDAPYRRCFARFDKRLEWISKRAECRAGFSGGVLMMIGTLGPGGAERQLVATARALRAGEKLDVDVAVACVSLAAPAQRFFQADLEAAHIDVALIGAEPEIAMPDELRELLRTLPSELHEVRQYATTLWARRPQIAHLWLDEINTKGGLAAVLTGVPKIIVSQRSLPPTNFIFHQPHMRETYRWLARRPNVFMINNSEAGARAYEAWLGLPGGTIGVVRNGYAFSDSEIASHQAARGRYREQTGIPAGAPVVGAVMRFSEEKQPQLWLEIAAHVRAVLPDAHFLIVGDGPLRKSLEKRALQPDLAGSVHFVGHLKDALDAIVDMDLLLLTSRVEGLPNVLVEAQFLGVPVAATPVGGAPEALDHGRSGWLLDGGAPLANAERIVALLKNTEWRKAAAEHGPRFVRERFSMRRAIDETLALYGDAINR